MLFAVKALTNVRTASVKTLRKFLNQHPGSSFPTEVESTDGDHCIIKMRGAGNGVRSLVGEFIVNRVAASVGLPVPDVFPITIPENFPWQFGTDEFDDLVQRSFGTNLGIRLVANARAVGADEVRALPSSFQATLAGIDALFCNLDRTRMSPNVLVDGAGIPWAIDHGSCVFLTNAAKTYPLALPAGHLLEDTDSAHAFALPTQETMRRAAADAVDALPQDWLDELEMPVERVRLAIEGRIERLP